VQSTGTADAARASALADAARVPVQSSRIGSWLCLMVDARAHGANLLFVLRSGSLVAALDYHYCERSLQLLSSPSHWSFRTCCFDRLMWGTSLREAKWLMLSE